VSRLVRARLAVTVAAAAAALTLAGCATGGGTSAPGAAGGDQLSGTITVFAAASLESTVTELAERFEADHPGVTVRLNVGGSSDLVTQLVEGAPGDVFASADERNMTTLVEEGLVGDGVPVDIATNTLQIVTPPGNPAGVETLADLAEPGVTTVVCAPQVPCGAAAAAVERAAGVDIAPVSEESSVTDVLGKVTSGEADAGLVYVTDALAAGDAVESIAFPEADEAINVYPVAPLAGSQNPDAASAFVELVAGEVGRGVLEAAGFGAP
jgi:molybdate transport system substrate-binding protein